MRKAQSETDTCLKRIPDFILWSPLQNLLPLRRHSKLVFPNTYSTYSYISIFPNKEWCQEEGTTSVKVIKGQRKKRGRNTDVTLYSYKSVRVFCCVWYSGFSLNSQCNTQTHCFVMVLQKKRRSRKVLSLVIVRRKGWLFPVFTLSFLSRGWVKTLVHYNLHSNA